MRFTFSTQIGAMLAQVFSPDGKSVAIFDATDPPEVANARAASMALLLNGGVPKWVQPAEGRAPDDPGMDELQEMLIGLAARLERAERTLASAGYKDCGGSLWRPPLGPSASPLLDKIDQLRAERDTAIAAALAADHRPMAQAEAGGAEPFWHAVVSKSHPIIDKAIRRHDVALDYAWKASKNYPDARDIEVVPLYRTSQPMNRDPLTDAQWLKKWTGFTGLRVKPGEDRDWLLGILRFAERTLGFSRGQV